MLALALQIGLAATGALTAGDEAVPDYVAVFVFTANDEQVLLNDGQAVQVPESFSNS